MNHFHYDFFGRQFLQGITEGFYLTIHITLDNDVQFFKVAQGKSASDFIQRNMFLSADALFPKYLSSFIGYFFGLSFIIVDLKFLTGLWRAVQAEDQCRG